MTAPVTAFMTRTRIVENKCDTHLISIAPTWIAKMKRIGALKRKLTTFSTAQNVPPDDFGYELKISIECPKARYIS